MAADPDAGEEDIKAKVVYRTYLIKECDTMIINEEVAFLAVHIQRLASR